MVSADSMAEILPYATPMILRALNLHVEIKRLAPGLSRLSGVIS